MVISAQELIQQVRFAAMSFPDRRTGKNTRYSMEDIVLSAFSVFFTQSPSFLSFQRAMQQQTGRNNTKSLFAVKILPTDTQIRRILDGIPPERLFPIFYWCLNVLVARRGIEQFKSELGYLLSLDGTGYFSSETIHCKNCLTKTDKKTGKATYYHSAITPVLVKPRGEHVLSLPPAFITPQDGDTKQDCELKASKRWLALNGHTYAKLGVTYLGDDLYAHEPFCRELLGKGGNFILVCKPDSHKTVYEWVKGITKEYVEDRFNGKTHQLYTYNYMEGIPLRDGEGALLVNFVEVRVMDRKSGKQLYHNAFVTNHPLTKRTLPLIVDCGRARWKIENENNNTLKTKGYHFEHNFGHGGKTLSLLLLTLILLAFLFHTVLDLFCVAYKSLCSQLRRQFFFNGIRELTQYFYVTSWEHLFTFMQEARTHQFVLPKAPFAILPLAPP